MQTWEQQHPEEVKEFWAIMEEMDCNVGSTSLYLSPAIKAAKHPWLEWVLSSRLNREQIHHLAPHAPFFEKVDYAVMEFSIRRWQVLYGHEYESLINHEAMIAVNPNYTEYLDVNQVPAFMQALPSETKPLAVVPSTDEQSLAEEVALQSWYFIYEPQQFEAVYGFYPSFPADFDEEAFRNFAKRTASTTIDNPNQ